MEPSSDLPNVPFRQNPRAGQWQVIRALREFVAYLNVQLPTGYGKTFLAMCVFALKKLAGDVNRLLVVFPTDAQLNQFEKDSESDRSDIFLAGIEGPRKVVDVRFRGAEAIQEHRKNTAQLFAITIQSLLQARGDDNVRKLMETGRWMVVIDEYHHYGFEKTWGRTVRSLPAQFQLAMSATPTRPKDDSAFGNPHIKVPYREAVDERAVKRLIGHSYNYRIDAIASDGSVRTYTTAELAQEAGSDSPDALERWRLEKQMRWSPKYVSPLVATPIERMIRDRITLGQPYLQVLIGAMCVSHAQLVCEQVQAMFPELRVDWVGTGPYGRPDHENKDIVGRFCPPKDSSGHRHPTLDVLVHVGIAGEGLDSQHVTEVVHLNRASKNNSNDQENGRASRWLAEGVIGNINFDSTSEYARFVGEAIMDAMDNDEPRKPGEDPDISCPWYEREFDPLPEEPTVLIDDIDLLNIDSGDLGVQRMATVMVDGLHVREFSRADINDPKSPIWDDAIRLYKEMRRREAEQQNSKSVVMQARHNVDLQLSAVTGRIIRFLMRNGQRPEKSLPGDIKKRINSRKKALLGEVTNDVDICRQHYRWLNTLEREIIQNGLPTWLS